MKRSTMNLMLATATLLVASTAASAQTMQAQIPFSFDVGGKVMAPGRYLVFALNGENLIRISSQQSGDAAVLPTGPSRDPRKEWTSTKGGVLLFACGDGCSLRQIWTNRGFPAHQLGANPSHGEAAPTRLAVIRLTVDRQ